MGDAQGRCSEMRDAAGVWEIGLELWDDGDRGRGLGRETVELLTSHLFADEEAIRVQATTDVDNAAMRRVLERLRVRRSRASCAGSCRIRTGRPRLRDVRR